MTIDPETLASIETAEEAERAFTLLQELADAVHKSPGGKAHSTVRIKPLTTDELRALCGTSSVELGVITHEVGRLLRGELDADGLRVMARKMVTLRGTWHDDIAETSRMNDTDLGELLKSIGQKCAIADSASVRHPGPPAPFEELRKSDGY
ncbi:MAG: hypothetical protein KDB68_10960 [Planctomycetes bacterium]|nr:hypothetical protein [Planctomycetota bacterium]MCA8947846.1 hypothetical protein [Planctomycetota bacterium]